MHCVCLKVKTPIYLAFSLQLLNRDARQAEVILNQQEHTLSKDESPTTLEQAENLLKRHEAFLTTMEANDDKINGVVQFSRRLCDEGHFASDKIAKRADNIDERRLANREKAIALMEVLRNQLELQQFLRDCDELDEWIQEKHITAQDETYRSAKTVHSKWTRHQAFEAEIAANKERLNNLQKAGEELAKEKPEYAEVCLFFIIFLYRIFLWYYKKNCFFSLSSRNWKSWQITSMCWRRQPKTRARGCSTQIARCSFIRLVTISTHG